MSDSFYKSPSSAKTCKPNKNARPINFASGSGNIRIVAEGNYPEGRHCTRGFFWVFIFLSKWRNEETALWKSEKLQHTYPLQVFQFKMDSLHCLKILLEQKDYPSVQDISWRRLLCDSYQQTVIQK